MACAGSSKRGTATIHSCWGGYGELGTGLALLYCSLLFQDPNERPRCVGSSDVKDEKALLRIVDLGQAALQTKMMPEIRRALDQIVVSSYFNEEKPGSVVLNTLEASNNKPSISLAIKLAPIYQCPSVYRLRVEEAAFEDLEKQAKARLTELVNPSAWSSCLTAMGQCEFLKHLLCSRPFSSTLPHFLALVNCVEHAWIWMERSKVKIYHKLEVTYANVVEKFLLDGNVHSQLYDRFDHGLFPRLVEKSVRARALNESTLGVCCPTDDEETQLKHIRAAKDWFR